MRLALAPLLGALLMLSGSCLVTAEPEPRRPFQTAPFFVIDSENGIVPDPRTILVVPHNSNQPLTFTATIRSEDLDQPVLHRFVRDYGTPPPGERPYVQATSDLAQDPGTWTDTERTITWSVPVSDVFQLGATKGCHRLTWLIAHQFSNNGCPYGKDDDPDDDSNALRPDYDEITWFVLQCDATGCPIIEGPDSCPNVLSSCADNLVAP